MKKKLQNQDLKFSFIEGKFNWKELMKINIKYIERTSDISSLYPYLPNILYNKLNLQNIDLICEEYIIQLVTLLQLTGQYFINIQKKNEEENNELKAIINKLKSDAINKEEYERLIMELQRQNQENQILIKSYQEMINDNNKNISEKNFIHKTYYYCNICLGKKFKTQKYLDEHMKRRHYNKEGFFTYKKIIEEEKDEKDNYRLDFENKLNTLREEFMNLINVKEDNNEYALLNKKLDLLQTQIISNNYNNIINNQNNNTNYFELNKYNKIIENNNKAQIELKIKYDELNKKYQDLLKKFEETKEIKIDFNRQKTHKEEKDKENNKINLNKIIKIDNNKIQIEIKPDKNNKNKIKIENEKNGESNKISGLNVIKNIFNDENLKGKIDIDEKFIINEIANKSLGLNSIKSVVNKDNKKGKLDNDNKINDNNNFNLDINIEDKKVFTNDGNEDNINKPENLFIQKKDENENNNNNINNNRDDKLKNIQLIQPNDDNNKLKIFYNQYKERDENILNEKINDYKKIEIPDKSNIELNEILEGKNYSEEFIKNYKNFEYLDKELKIKELLASYKRLQEGKNPNQNQVIIKKSTFANNNNNALKSSINKIIEEEPNKLKISKTNEAVESSFIKGFDLVKSTK